MELRSGFTAATYTSNTQPRQRPKHPVPPIAHLDGDHTSQDSKQSVPQFLDSWLYQAEGDRVAQETVTAVPPQAKRVRLTKQNLKQHTRLAEKQMAPRKKAARSPQDPNHDVEERTTTYRTSSKSNGTSSSKTTTTDPHFGEKLIARHIRHGIYQPRQPIDTSSVRNYLDRERESQSPGEEDFEIYNERLKACHTEDEVRDELWRLLAKDPPRGFYNNVNGQWNAITNELIGGLSVPKPDRSMSYQIESYPEAAVESLGSALRPSGGTMAMPHLCIEIKTPTANFQNAVEQAAYDGAVMVNGAHEVHQYLQRSEDDFYGNTKALTVAFNGTTSRVFANHAVQSKDKTLEYHQAPLLLADPTMSLDDFKRTRKHIRNAQDWAREHEKQKLDDLTTYETIRTQETVTPISPPVSAVVRPHSVKSTSKATPALLATTAKPTSRSSKSRNVKEPRTALVKKRGIT